MSKAYNIATNLAAYQNTFDNPNVLNMNTVNVTDINSSNNATLKNLKMSSTSHEWTIKGIDSAIGDTQAGVSPDTTDIDSGQLAIYNGATKLWGITEHGYVVNPYTPSFSVEYKDNDGAADYANAKVIFNTIKTNNGNHYSTTTGLFTAPISGNYFFDSSIRKASGGVAYFGIRIYKNNVQQMRNRSYAGGGGYTNTVSINIVLSLSAGDTVYIHAEDTGVGGNLDSQWDTSFFTGFLIG